MDELLSQINIRVRRYKPVMTKGGIYTEWRENKILQVTYRSKGCQNSAHGSCLMCDYGVGKNLTLEEAETVLPEVLRKGCEEINELILTTYGSFLDEYEVPKENRRVILRQVAETKIPYITFETHYKTISREIIDEINSYIGDKIIAYEMGLESVDSYVLSKCLNKDIDLEELKKCIELIHSYHHAVIFNVLYGSPFLNEKQQIEDVLESIHWAYEQDAEVIVLFPVNIKPFTVLEHMYMAGFYKPVSQWGLIKILASLPEEVLDRINIAWYGNREIKYPKYKFKTIFPVSCEKCRDHIFDFYFAFTADRDKENRKKLLKEIVGMKMKCRCREQAWETIESAGASNGLREEACKYLQRTVLKGGIHAIPWEEH